MKVSEMLRLLKEDGWFLHREGKKHSLYKHETKTGTVILGLMDKMVAKIFVMPYIIRDYKG